MAFLVQRYQYQGSHSSELRRRRRRFQDFLSTAKRRADEN
jgi:hypothetical protein